MPIKQDNRSLAIKTALGPDVLAVRSIAVQEQISRLFQIEAELSSEDSGIDLDKVIGKDVTLRLNVAQKDKRYFAGIVSRLVQVANHGGHAHYRATIVPWLWFLTRTSDCYIFQDMTVPDIIEDVFKHFGFNDYKLKLSATYPKWEFCVQYRETDFNFVSRLMEQEGIYYYFEHEDGKHTLVLADSISAHKPFPGYAEVTFHELEQGAAAREVISDWTVEKEVQPVAYAVQDFDFKKPKTSLLASSNVPRKYGKAEYEIYDYPGEYLEHGEGERLADVRLNELQSQYEVLHGQASARGLAAGHTFKLKNHPRADQNREYFITGASLRADAGEFAAAVGGGVGTGEFFSCSVTAIDKSQQFRPARLTPKPIVQGPQTAIVVGPSGEEIYTDEHARVKVHFHWDRHDKSDENSSCWIRVSQYWAGKEWGTIHIPRIGQEVIVEFLEGDPDEPIITGRVYNADQVPPYALPANKTQSGIKSRSSKGGSAPNFNEIRFEDKKGSEEVYIHAEKDQNNVVEHDETTKVGHDRTEDVGNDEKISISNDRTESVGREESISIGGNRTEDVTKNESVTVGENRTLSVSKDETKDIGGKRSLSVGKDESVEVAENRTKSVGKDETVTVQGDLKETVGKSQSTKVSKGIVVDAGDEIMLKTGSASITMKKDGTITIKGKDVNIEGSGKIQIKASSDVIIKGSKIAQN
jgi:type VI secretion system secreted protein VgrG